MFWGWRKRAGVGRLRVSLDGVWRTVSAMLDNHVVTLRDAGLTWLLTLPDPLAPGDDEEDAGDRLIAPDSGSGDAGSGGGGGQRDARAGAGGAGGDEDGVPAVGAGGHGGGFGVLRRGGDGAGGADAGRIWRGAVRGIGWLRVAVSASEDVRKNSRAHKRKLGRELAPNAALIRSMRKLFRPA